MSGGLAWIVDGSTGVSGTSLTPEQSDAAWLVRMLDRGLQAAKTWPAMPGVVLKGVERELEAAFCGIAPEVPAEGDHLAPAACLGLLALHEAGARHAVVSGAFLGDVVALFPSGSGVLRWTDERAKPFERLTLASLEGHSFQGDIPERTRRQIMENRTKLNQPDGFWLVHPLRPWAGHELAFEAKIEAGCPIVLATDGFMRLVDVFGSYTDETLYDALVEGRAGDLMQELRDFEAEEDGSTSCPRVKPHDDATVLVVAAEAEN